MTGNKLWGLVGICRRAGHLFIGFDAVAALAADGRAKQILLASDLSEKTAKELRFVAEKHAVPLAVIPTDKEALGALLEASEALSAEYGVEMGSLIDFSYELLSRFDNKLLGDTVDRVGRDTVRKLARADRLTGTALLCMKHGIEPKFIREGMLAALDFVADGDASSAEVAAFASKAGKRSAFVKYCGLDEKDEGDRALLDYLLER